MLMPRPTWIATAALAALTSAGIVAQTPVRSIEDGALDEIKLYVEKLPSTTAAVVIRPFSATAADLTEGAKDGEDTKKMQTEAPPLLAETFVTSLKKLGPFTDVSVASGSATPAGALVIEGKFIEMDPGSRAARIWVGYGAGKSGVTAKGTVKSDGKLIAEFQQRRIGMRGKTNIDILREDTKTIGDDIAKFLNKWATGKKLN
jgi:hypothetical protein